LEQGALNGIARDILSRLFDFMVRDIAGAAVQIYDLHNSRDDRRAYCREIAMVRAQGDRKQYDRGRETYAGSLNGEYEMNR